MLGAVKPAPISIAFQAAVTHLEVAAYRTKCVSTLGASAQVDAPFSAV